MKSITKRIWRWLFPLPAKEAIKNPRLQCDICTDKGTYVRQYELEPKCELWMCPHCAHQKMIEYKTEQYDKMHRNSTDKLN